MKPLSMTSRLMLGAGPVHLSAYATDATPGFDGGRRGGEAALAALGPTLLDLQTKLFAMGRSGERRQLLVVLQGMDTSGKGGVLVKTVGLMDPQGLKITSFKAPTATERAHDFLWRIEKAVPGAGMVGVFDRSHYEDVLIGRVRELAEPAEIERRYGAIAEFEQRLTSEGTTVIKCFLHISPEEQKQRLFARLDDPTKYWKFNPGDVDERQMWAEYTEAYEIALERTHTETAPWFVVPSDRKWFRNLAVAQLIREALDRMEPHWPGPSFDVAEQRARLEADTIS